MTLAKRLDELATANSEGLLDDDEYRLLRQNLFERYTNGTIVPTEAPVVPLGTHIRGTSASAQQRRNSVVQLESNRSSIPSTRPTKSTIVSGINGVGSFLKLSTSKKVIAAPHDDKRQSISMDIGQPSSRRNIVSRMLSRKGSKVLTLQTDVTSQQATVASPRSTELPRTKSITIPPSPTTPSSWTYSSTSQSISHAATPPTSPSSSVRHRLPMGTISDVFNDEGLYTSQQIRQEILNVEAECNSLIDAFNGLEMTTFIRTQAQELRRLPAPTPASPMVVLEGRDWRDYSQIAASTSRLSNLHTTDSDGVSLHSVSSKRSSRSSRPASIFGKLIRPRTPQRIPSPLSTNHASPSKRKSSVSSLSSQGTSPLSHSAPHRVNSNSNLLMSSSSASTGTSKLSKSTGNLPLNVLPESQSAQSSDDVADTGGTDGKDTLETPRPSHQELADIRRRKAEVMNRYEARLDYLRAKLKGAELHEKLLRK